MDKLPTRQRRPGRPVKAEAQSFDDAFLDHALKAFTEKGYRAVTMAKLASSFGTAKSTLFRKYGSKAGLLRAAMERGVPILFEQLRAVRTDTSRPAEDVLRDFGIVLQTHHADPIIQAMWHAVSEAKEDLGAGLDDAMEKQRTALRPLADYIARLKSTGSSDPIDCHTAAAAFMSVVTGGLTSFLGGTPTNDERAAMIEFGVPFFLAGIGLATPNRS